MSRVQVWVSCVQVYRCECHLYRCECHLYRCECHLYRCECHLYRCNCHVYRCTGVSVTCTGVQVWMSRVQVCMCECHLYRCAGVNVTCTGAQVWVSPVQVYRCECHVYRCAGVSVTCTGVQVWMSRVQVLMSVKVHVALSFYVIVAAVAGTAVLLLPIETKGRAMKVRSHVHVTTMHLVQTDWLLVSVCRGDGRYFTLLTLHRWLWEDFENGPHLAKWWAGRQELSQFHALTSSWRVTTYVSKTSAIGQPTRPAQPFILSGSINWVVSSWSRCAPPCSGDAIWWMLTKWMQDGSFRSWINVWVAGNTVWTPCHLARSSRWSLFVECKRWTDCISFHFN